MKNCLRSTKFLLKKLEVAMNKILLVLQREYITRVRNKTFLLTTFLTPLGILLLVFVVGLIMKSGSDSVKNIAVTDEQNLLENSLQVRDNLQFLFSEKSIEKLKEEYKLGLYDGVLEITPIENEMISEYTFYFHSDKPLAVDEQYSIKSAISEKVRNYKLLQLNIDTVQLAQLETKVNFEPKVISTDKKLSSITAIVSGVLGGVVGYLMFFIIVMYGTQVMRSVTEEKTNRIVEILISSVKPFQLMMGKVVGVGLVGLTQIVIWLILIPVILLIGVQFMGLDEKNIGEISSVSGAQMQESQEMMLQVFEELKSMNWLKIISITLFYFLGGYFTYAAIFAALGSAVGEDANEAQTLTFPVMLPLMIAVYIAISAVTSPNSSLAVWSSMFPLFSPIIMPVRLPFDPPLWELLLSMLLLVAFAVFFVWLAGRIYRVGILMHGKKVGFKELAKWLFMG